MTKSLFFEIYIYLFPTFPISPFSTFPKWVFPHFPFFRNPYFPISYFSYFPIFYFSQMGISPFPFFPTNMNRLLFTYKIVGVLSTKWAFCPFTFFFFFRNFVWHKNIYSSFSGKYFYLIKKEMRRYVNLKRSVGFYLLQQIASCVFVSRKLIFDAKIIL